MPSTACLRPAPFRLLWVFLAWTGWVCVAAAPLSAGQFEPETNLHKDLGPLAPRQVMLGQFWNHTPAYYQARIDALSPKVTPGKVTRELFGQVDQLAVAYLQLQRYSDALATLELKREIDAEDYGLHANRSMVYARRAYAGRSEADGTTAAADWQAAIAEAQIALAKPVDPLKRDALYARVIDWLAKASNDASLRETQSVLGYDIRSKAQAALDRDRAAGVTHAMPMSPADMAKLLGEDPALMDTLGWLAAVDSLAVPDLLLALADLSAVGGEIQTAYVGYCRLGELGGVYPGEFLERRRQTLLQTVTAQVAVGSDETVAVAMGPVARRSLDEQCYQHYLAERRAAKVYSQAYDQYETEQLKLATLPSQRKLLESFHKQISGDPGISATGPGVVWEEVAHVDDFDSRGFLIQIAIWVPAALVCVTVLMSAVRWLRRYDKMSVGS